MSEGFDYGNARVRARRADLIDRPGYQELATLDIDGVLAALSDGPYRTELVAATPRYGGLRLLEEALRVNLANTLRDLAAWYDGDAGRQVGLVVGRWDLRNIRTILRGHYARATPDEMKAALVPAGSLDETVLAELAGQSGLRPAIELMVSWGVPTRATAATLATALAEFESSADFQTLERALNRADADELRRLLREAEPDVASVLVTEIDLTNLTTAIRLNEAGAVDPQWDLVEPAERFLRGGRLPMASLLRIAGSADRAAALAAVAADSMPESWRLALERWSESGDAVALGDELDAWLRRAAVALFATSDPLGPGVPLAFVWAKQTEVENLRTVGAAVVAGLSPTIIEEALVIL